MNTCYVVGSPNKINLLYSILLFSCCFFFTGSCRLDVAVDPVIIEHLEKIMMASKMAAQYMVWPNYAAI